MIYYIIYCLAILVIWIGIELAIAPEGYEDEEGFHYGTPENKKSG